MVTEGYKYDIGLSKKVRDTQKPSSDNEERLITMTYPRD